MCVCVCVCVCVGTCIVDYLIKFSVHCDFCVLKMSDTIGLLNSLGFFFVLFCFISLFLCFL